MSAALSAFIETLDGKRDIPQIEFIAGDQAVMLTIRHMQPLSDSDSGLDNVYPVKTHGRAAHQFPYPRRERVAVGDEGVDGGLKIVPRLSPFAIGGRPGISVDVSQIHQ